MINKTGIKNVLIVVCILAISIIGLCGCGEEKKENDNIVRIRYSSEYYRNHRDAVENNISTLKYEGFKNIQLEPIYDLSIGLITKEKQVEKVVIDGKEIFSEGDEFLNTCPVVIYYHDFSRNDPKNNSSNQSKDVVDENITGYLGTFIGIEKSIIMLNKNTAIYYLYNNKNEVFEEVDYYIENNNIVIDTSKTFNYKIYFELRDTYYDSSSYEIKSTNEKWKIEKMYKWSSKFDFTKEELKKIARSSKSIKRMNIDKLQNMLKGDGYTNIVLSPIYDVIFGIVNYVGEIDRIAIDGETQFNSYLDYPKDIMIKIYYHEDTAKKPESVEEIIEETETEMNIETLTDKETETDIETQIDNKTDISKETIVDNETETYDITIFEENSEIETIIEDELIL